MNARRQRGNALVELTFAIMLLVSMCLGAFQFGYAFYVYNQLVEGLRAGARYASVNSATSPGYTGAVQNVVVYGTPSPDSGTPKVVLGLRPADVNVTNTGTTVRLTVSNFGIGVWWPIVLNNKPVVEFPYTAS